MNQQISESSIPIEEVYYYNTKKWYRGKMPAFFSEEQIPAMTVLRKNYPEIKQEIESYFSEGKGDFKVNFIAHNYSENGWKTVGLYAYCLKRKKNCEALPFTTSVIESLPGLTTAIVSVLEPHTSIKPHLGDTNAIARIHLPIRIPGNWPELGMIIDRTPLWWKEGETVAFNVVKRHKAWNHTDYQRIVLIVDVIHDQYLDKKLTISGNVLGGFVMKYVASRIPILKKIPGVLTVSIHRTLGFLAYCRLLSQRSLGI